MICPHCGQETTTKQAQCIHCGYPLGAGANWGVRKPSNTYQAQYSSDTEKLTSFVAASPHLRKTKPLGVKIALGLLATAFVVAIGYGGFTIAQQTVASSSSAQTSAERIAARMHPVQLGIEAPGLDDSGTLIPVQITGADAGNNAYEKVAFVHADGTGLKLPAGNYGVAPLASPISANGSLYLYSTNNKWFQISGDLAEGESVDATEDATLVFEIADPSDISEESIQKARKYAIEGGMSEASVDTLLAGLQESMAEAKRGGPLGSVQEYRGKTFVGDVRTNTGYVPVSGVPDVSPIITRTDAFLFAGNTLYYADHSPNYSGNQIALHSRNMSTGQETILATDLGSLTTPYYTNGQLVYSTPTWGQSVKRLDIASGESFPVSENLPWEFSKLVGVKDNFALVATADGNMPQICFAPLGEGEQSTVSFGEESGNVVGVFDDTVVISYGGWDSSKLAAYSLDGSRLWEKDVQGNTQLGNYINYYDGILAAISSGGTAVVWVDLADGNNKVFDANVAYLFEVIYANNKQLYFAGSNQYASYDNYGTAMATYTTYEVDIETGKIRDLGSYEAPQDDDLAQQQENMYWNDTSTWSDTNTTDTGNTPEGDTDTGTNTNAGENATESNTGSSTQGYGLDPTYGDWDAEGRFVGQGQGGYDQSGNPVS